MAVGYGQLYLRKNKANYEISSMLVKMTNSMYIIFSPIVHSKKKKKKIDTIINDISYLGNTTLLIFFSRCDEFSKLNG